MKRSFLLKSMLLLCALIAGSSSVWADDITYTFNSKSWGATVGDDDANWTSGKDGGSLQSGRGVQVSTGQSGANATSPTSINNISKIVVTYSTNANAGAGSIKFQVGSGEEKSQNVTKSGGTTDRTLTYNFSPNETGKVKITVTCTTNSIYVKSVKITYSNVTKEANGLAWSAASKDVTYSETPYNLPTLTNPHSLAISYDSSDKSVATIDSEGNITIKNKTGNTTISASTEGDNTYAAGSVSYTLNVTRKVVIEDGVFNFGFGPSDGGDYGSEMTQGSDIIENQSKTWTAGNIMLVVANRYAWNTDGKMVIYKKAGNANAAGSITISCPTGKVITKIELTGPYSGTGALSNSSANTGTYTVTSSSAIWTGAAQSVSFTASNSTYIYTITVTYGDEVTTEVQSYGWASYITPAAVEFEANTAYVVTAASVSAGLTLEAITEAPAGTPLLLKGAGEKTITVVASATAPATNLLTISDGSDLASGEYPYVLAKEGTGACFKQWTGEMSTLNGRVVLVLDEAVATSSPVFSLDGNTTGISSIDNGQMTIDNSEVYNLNGQRVAQPTKGLYIVNGKKVIIK